MVSQSLKGNIVPSIPCLLSSTVVVLLVIQYFSFYLFFDLFLVFFRFITISVSYIFYKLNVLQFFIFIIKKTIFIIQTTRGSWTEFQIFFSHNVLSTFSSLSILTPTKPNSVYIGNLLDYDNYPCFYDTSNIRGYLRSGR